MYFTDPCIFSFNIFEFSEFLSSFVSPFIMPPTSKKLRGHMVSDCPCVRS